MDVDNYNKKQIGCNDKYTAFVAIAAHKKVRFPKIPYHYPVCVGAYKNR